MELSECLATQGWTVVHETSMPPRDGQVIGTDDLALSEYTRHYLQTKFPDGVYKHQKEAVSHFLAGRNVCLTTAAASGKSLAFYLSALEMFSKDPQARVLAMYPLKALGREQEGRWRDALGKSGQGRAVGLLDGQVPMTMREGIVARASVLIATPDIVHAWLLPNIGAPTIRRFFEKLSLFIVDEIHTYTGVFGSNAAFLFRRMQHVMKELGSEAQYICASATIEDPLEHLASLFGLDFTVVGQESDTSPTRRVDVQLLEAPGSSDFLSELSKLLYNIASGTTHNFLTFVDSRKQTEHITSIIDRWRDIDAQGEDQAEPEVSDISHLDRLDVLPFRAGYESRDSNVIQGRLTEGTLRGVVSTSALELGIDIPHLTLGVLVGVPHSSTSLLQRIGRIGRHADGRVLIINTGDVYDEMVFRRPQELLRRPMAECALYVENPRIQYISALCLARQGGEHDQARGGPAGEDELGFDSAVSWPPGFVDLCRLERLGQIGPEFQPMKMEAGDDPNHTYPLRDVESQFHVIWKRGPEVDPKGSLSYSQVMRETYPGAIYYYTTIPFRVYHVDLQKREILVRREKRYTTRPTMLPTQVFPNLSAGSVYRALKAGDLVVVECDLQVRESVVGFRERRGSTEHNYPYPLDRPIGNLRYTKQFFTRNYFTTGVVISHPALNRERVDVSAIAALLYEAFLVVIPFERRDLNFGAGRYRAKGGPLARNDAFICVYDQTYGSLRLSGRILETEVLQRMFEQLIELAAHDETADLNHDTLMACHAMAAWSTEDVKHISISERSVVQPTAGEERVIMPGSTGLWVGRANQQVRIEGVFFSPAQGTVCYRADVPDETGYEFERSQWIIPLAEVVEIPGESEIGLYDYGTGEAKPVKKGSALLRGPVHGAAA